MNLSIIKNAKISVKLTLIYAFMFSLVLLILSTVTLYGTKYFLYKQADKQVNDISTVLIDKINDEAGEVSLYNKDFLADLPSKENMYIRILDNNDNVIGQSRDFNYDIKLKETNGRTKHLEQREKHLMYLNTKLNSKNYGVVYIQVVKDLESEYSFIKILFVFLAIADFIGMVASIVVGYIISKKMLNPIDNITRTAENISVNNLKERIEVNDADDELKRLAGTLNNMIDRLQKAFDSQSQFVSDASHELRTPIAVIQGYANLLDRWGKNDKEALEKSIYGIKLEAENMANLVEKLLFLAKGDALTQVVEKKEFHLNELIDEVLAETKLIDKKHNIFSDENEDIDIYGDYKLIKQMLRIFIENSIKFTPDKGVITINSILRNKSIYISVSDTGIGIPKDDIQNIFDRFYTVDKSRSKEKGGTGLGLSIAKWIAEVHDGIIEVESEEGKGTSVIVKININE
ncbi:HAMP domain-containing sensor histidine kinase [Clostridium fungisolvens]|uniref:Signal transduction histidine-protein kinase ArlS n=1 Tax=Clostridium fungisolvens TaxID=1604897 RepID=A0A6V8SSG2_9CLOT|nr:HAMP domain-containing histidine kinase [Clostridium fungisolvens]GFP78188.1 Adaptive-response sensory-kinase SasA [Clostridium fungisolvens]